MRRSAVVITTPGDAVLRSVPRRLAAFLAAALVGLALIAQVLAGPPARAASSAPSATGHATRATPVATIVNGDSAGATLRFDTAGNAIDAHDGGISEFGGTYYLYGTSYGCGFTWQGPGTPFCGFQVYSSTDLTHWTDRGPLFDASTATWQQRCNGSTYGCFRPHVIYDARTHRYVLWINSYDNSVDYHVFTATRPTGPFTEQAAPTLAINQGAPPTGVNNGDENLFVDQDGTAYLVYSDWIGGGDLVIEQLSPDDLTGTGHYVRLNTRSTEAPSLFRRGSRYYVTYSDPNCGYCAGTGTSYLTASSPLGPWTGSGTAPDSWQVADGQLTVTGGDIGLSKAGAGWTDYTMSFDTTPLQTGGGGTYAQAGWVFRASDTGTGYAWLLGNYPYAGAESGSLTKVVFSGGQVVSSTVVPLPFPVVGGDTYSVATTVSGPTITTTINGTVVDTTTDTRFAAGRVGFRESGDESARFADLKVTAPDGTVLLADSFDGDLSAWARPAPVVLGTSISATSCGGQPDNVAVLPGPDGPTYLYASDRWANGAHNQSLATQDWEPLRFTAGGAIEPLTCATTVTVPLARPARPRPAPRAGTEGPGNDGFHSYCDIGGSIERAQVFTVGRTGLLSAVQDTSFQSGSPNQPLMLRVTTVAADGTPSATTLASTTVPAVATSWAPAWVTLAARLHVRRGEKLALVISSPLTAGCYGLAYSDANPYPAGDEYYSNNGGTTWTAETGRGLHFRVTIR